MGILTTRRRRGRDDNTRYDVQHPHHRTPALSGRRVPAHTVLPQRLRVFLPGCHGRNEMLGRVRPHIRLQTPRGRDDRAPDNKVFYRKNQQEYDWFKFTANKTGTYRACFSNIYNLMMFSNVVYLDFVIGDEDSLTPGST